MKWRKYVHGVANPRIEAKEQNIYLCGLVFAAMLWVKL